MCQGIQLRANVSRVVGDQAYREDGAGVALQVTDLSNREVLLCSEALSNTTDDPPLVFQAAGRRYDQGETKHANPD